MSPHSVVVRPRSVRPLHRSLSLAVPVLLAALAWLLLPGSATAEPPFRLPQPITDTAGVLDPAETAQIEQAADALYAEHGVQLWVAYVPTFSGLSSDDWTERTAQASNFGTDTALLAVATQDREYALWTPNALSGVTASERDAISTDRIVPQLRDENWAGAAVAAAEGLDEALSASGSGSGTTLLVGDRKSVV